jgi:hypothetical protein
LQPDPIGFKGDASNLYRYCGNDWANRTDPMGLQAAAGDRRDQMRDPDNGVSEQLADSENRFEVCVETATKVELAGGNMTVAAKGGGWGVSRKDLNQMSPRQLGMVGVQWAERDFKDSGGDYYGYNFYRVNNQIVWNRSQPGRWEGGAWAETYILPDNLFNYLKANNGVFVANGHLHPAPDREHGHKGESFSPRDERLSQKGPVLKRNWGRFPPNNDQDHYDEVYKGKRSLLGPGIILQQGAEI